MLEQLLQYLVDAEGTTLDRLASRLSVSADLLEQMLADLERGGYVLEVPLQCERHCAGCPDAGLCAVLQGRRAWRVTDKGFRLVAEGRLPE